ncbi:MAG: J domain-containing protein [Acidobacteriaceae bacterium]
MASEIVRQITPEEAELARKRVELASVQAALAERELELADLRAQLKSFEGRYLRQVGVLYAELDDWDARVAELEATLESSSGARERAERARKRADDTHQVTHGEASRVPDFKPPAELRNLYREVARRVHPDFARDDADRELRNRFMADASEAYKHGDAEALQRILSEYSESAESVPGEGIGSELIRIIRQIATAKKHIAAIQQELGSVRASELAKLRADAESVAQQGRDLLAELAISVGEQVAHARREYEVLAGEVARRARRT